jgi:GNAT superfamily N-acetyltransferase
MSEIYQQIALRNWKELDFEDSVKLNCEAEKGLGIPPETGDWRTDMLGVKRTFIDSGGEFLVGHLNEELVIMGGFKPLDNKVAEVKRMRVSPSLHRKGLGKWMLKTIEQRMKIKGYSESRVSTLDAQEAALGLYESSGYEEISRDPASGMESGFKVVTFIKKL